MTYYICSILQSSSLGLHGHPTSAIGLQVPGHVLQPSQNYMSGVSNSVPPVYMPASQPLPPQNYPSGPPTAQPHATVTQLLQHTQSIPAAPQVQVNAAIQSYTPVAIANSQTFSILQQATAAQTLQPVHQVVDASSSVLPVVQQAAGETNIHLPDVLDCRQPASTYIPVQYISSIQSFQENVPLQSVQTAASSLQHGLATAPPMQQQAAQQTSRTSIHQAELHAQLKEVARQTTSPHIGGPADSLLSHMVSEMPAVLVSLVNLFLMCVILWLSLCTQSHVSCLTPTAHVTDN